MPDFLELAAILLIPAVTAPAVAVVTRWWLPGRDSFTVPLAAAVGFAVGCWTYGDRLPLVPEKHWQWLPYLGLVAALFNTRDQIGRTPRWVWLVSHASIAGLIAFQLTPNYPDLQPPPLILALLMWVYFTSLMWLLSLLPPKLLGQRFVALLMLVAGGTALLVASAISLRIGTVALRAPAVFLVAAMFAWLAKKTAPEITTFSLPNPTAVGSIPLYVALVGGSSFVGATALSERWLLLLAPAAPLALWLFAWGPLARLEGKTAIVIQWATVLSIVVALLVWFNWPDPAAAEWS